MSLVIDSFPGLFWLGRQTNFNTRKDRDPSFLAISANKSSSLASFARGSVVRLLLTYRRTRAAFLIAGTAYLPLYLIAVGDLGFGGFAHGFSARAIREPISLMFSQITPFRFEAIAVLTLPFVTYLFSPLNLLVGSALSVLVGMNLALVYGSYLSPRFCPANATTGILTALPALLAGSACCSHVLLIALGIQDSAVAISLLGALVPLAFVVMGAALVWNARRVDVDWLRAFQ
jgi:hypothetical protein